MAKKVKVSLVVTVLNEEKTIDLFLDSLLGQKLKPDEIIIVDGGSTDLTWKKLTLRKKKIKLFLKKGNRAIGRNFGVKKAQNSLIAFTDAGCLARPNWLKEIVKPFSDPKVEVVAGYYGSRAMTAFEKCVVPFALVMPDRIDQRTFLPSSRSMAVKKKFYLKNGGFSEDFPDNEDYVFASRLKKNQVKIVFCPLAIVDWLPRSSLKGFWTMIYRFARGDAQAGLRKVKVFGVYWRYIFFLLFFTSGLIFNELMKTFLVLFFFYLLFSVRKNYRYVKNYEAFFWLPVLQIVSDLAVMSGSLRGFLKRA